MRNSLWGKIFGLLLLAPLLLAMGGGGGPVSDTIPRPQQKHDAVLTDLQGVTTRASEVSCNGKTFFPLVRGEGTLMVPFGKVERAEVSGQDSGTLRVTLYIAGGSELQGTLPRSLLCTGVTEYGNFQIELRGLQKVEFQAP